MTNKFLSICFLLLVLIVSTNTDAQNIRIDPPGWESPDDEYGPWIFEPFDFGDVMIGDSVSVTFHVISVGPTPLALHDVILLDNPNGAFAITAIDTIPPELMPGEWVNVELTYSPLEPGTHTATLRVGSNDANLRWHDGPLTGTAVPEPATMSLLALGGIVVMIRRRRNN